MVVLSLGMRKLVGVSSFNQTLTKSFSTAAILFSQRQTKTTKNFRKDIVIRNIDEHQQSPLMVIVGWSNSNNKQVARYSELYEKQGLTTISMSCKMYRFAMFYDSLFADDTKACIDALESQRDVNKERKVFFKLFSTPGPAMYVNIMNYFYQYIQGHFGTDRYQIANVLDRPNISGIIWDSPTVASGNAAQFANGMKANSTNPVLNYMFDVLGKAVYAYAVRTSKMHTYGPEFLRNIPAVLPQLMLYSKADKIAGYRGIQAYIAQQIELGNSVDSHMWESSSHVVHYREHREEYERLVTEFLEKCCATSCDVTSAAESESAMLETDDELPRKQQL